MSLPQEPREPLLVALRAVDPAAWRREVAAVLLAQGEVAAAGRALGVARATLERWIAEEPALRAALAG